MIHRLQAVSCFITLWGALNGVCRTECVKIEIQIWEMLKMKESVWKKQTHQKGFKKWRFVCSSSNKILNYSVETNVWWLLEYFYIPRWQSLNHFTVKMMKQLSIIPWITKKKTWTLSVQMCKDCNVERTSYMRGPIQSGRVEFWWWPHGKS